MTLSAVQCTRAALLIARKHSPLSAKQLATLMGCTRNCAHLYLSRLRDQKLVEHAGTRTFTGGRPEFLWSVTELGHVRDTVASSLPSRPKAPRKSRSIQFKPVPVTVVAAPASSAVGRPPALIELPGMVARAIRSQPDLAKVWNDRRAA